MILRSTPFLIIFGCLLHSACSNHDSSDKNSGAASPKAINLIKLDKPLPNMDISSPLTIKGKARGSWYFEGNFSVELQDAAGTTLAEKLAKAQGKWMTEEFVPFSVTLKFSKAPDDERGRLIFHRANPSGKPENDMEYTQPVIFPPK